MTSRTNATKLARDDPTSNAKKEELKPDKSTPTEIDLLETAMRSRRPATISVASFSKATKEARVNLKNIRKIRIYDEIRKYFLEANNLLEAIDSTMNPLTKMKHDFP